MLAAAFFSSTMNGAIRHLSSDLHPFEIAFFRNLFGLIVLLPALLRTGLVPLRTQKLPLHALRGLFNVGAMMSFFLGVSMTPLATVAALSFTSPLFATLLAASLLGERVRHGRIAGLAIGFAGMLVILRPGLAVIDPATPIVLLSALTFAVVIVIGKRLAGVETPEGIVLQLTFWSIPLSALPAAWVWVWPSAEQLVWLAALGLAAWANIYGISRALQAGDASLAMAFDFLRLPAVALVGFFAYAERPDPLTWIGAAVIVAGVVHVTRAEARAARAAQ